MVSDQDLDSDETPSPSSPLFRLLQDEMEEAEKLGPQDDNCSDSSWEAEPSSSKFGRKSSRPKIPPRPHFIAEDGHIRKRGVRCMECPACLRKDDCGQCEMCKDKRKFGGPGIKKQACMYVCRGAWDGGGGW